MKKGIGLFLAVVLMPAMSAQAWIGGPWSANTYASNGDDGVYEAVATMTDGVGMYRWGVGNNPGGIRSNVLFNGKTNYEPWVTVGGAISPHVWFYRGITYYGECYGLVNSMVNKVVVTGTASNLGGGDGTGSGGAGLNTTYLLSPGIGLTSNGPGDQNPKGWCNSSWHGKITGKRPFVRFHGVGRVNFFGEPFIEYSTPASVSPSGTNILVGGAGELDYFTNTGHGRSFRVYGSKVSHQVSGITGAAALAP